MQRQMAAGVATCLVPEELVAIAFGVPTSQCQKKALAARVIVEHVVRGYDQAKEEWQDQFLVRSVVAGTAV